MLNYIKKNLTSLPYFIGKPISYIPYSSRPGIKNLYKIRRSEIAFMETSDVKGMQEFIFKRVKKIAEFAYRNIPFYADIYSSANINPSQLKCFDELNLLPIIDKKLLQSVSLEDRSIKMRGRTIVNTGGSSGQPLSFYIETSSIAHEWAHMHHIWSRLGFVQSNLKIVFAGRSDVRNVVEYDSARHQLSVDIYKSWDVIADSLLKIFSHYMPTYLHGYPSSIFDFIFWLNCNKHPLLPILKKNIKGMLLGSESPSILFRPQIEALLECKSVSWYGHTERAILAYEKETAGTYFPFHSYGYAEVTESSEGFKLLGTSYYNHASPLIRYDTGDLITPTKVNGLLDSFKVTNGREGEFILDINKNKIFLTALIFGRHHQLFNQCMHLQVLQNMAGFAEILFVPFENSTLTSQDARDMFDNSNVLIDFSFRMIKKPLRTPSGKIPLLVSNLIVGPDI